MVDAAGAILVVLTRAPSSSGKSRLFHTLNMPPDAALLRALLLDTLDGAALPGLRRVIAVTPASACDEVREMAGTIDVMPQAEGDLGDRMQASMETLFREGATAVVLIGADLPHIDAALIARSLRCARRRSRRARAWPIRGWRLLPDWRVPRARRVPRHRVGQRSRVCVHRTRRVRPRFPGPSSCRIVRR